MSSQPKRTQLPPLTYIRCRVGQRDYALNIIWILDIQRATALSVDLQNSGQVGWVKTLGQEIPIYDLAGRLRLKRPRFDPDQHRIILINAAPNFGILVESVSQATEVSAKRVFGLPAFARNPEKDYFEGVVVTADGPLPLLNPLEIIPLFKPDPLQQPQEHFPPPHFQEIDPGRLKDKALPADAPALATFSLAEQAPEPQRLLYGLSKSQILEIMPPAFITALPSSPPHVIGLTQWQGIPLPLIDIGALLGRKTDLNLTKQKEYRFVLARDKSGRLACLCVQADIDIRPTPLPSRVSEREVAYKHPAVRGVFELAQQTVAVLDTSRLWAVG